MDSYLAFIGSLVIGSLLLWRVLTFQADLKEHSYKESTLYNMQNSAMGVVEVLDQDFKNMGLGISPPIFMTVDDDTVEFNTDLDGDSNPDLIRYQLSGTDVLANTPNPNDRILYRQVNADAKLAIAQGVTNFNLQYFDQNGVTTTTPADIKTLDITLQMESATPYEGEYSSFLWRQKITPPNLLF